MIHPDQDPSTASDDVAGSRDEESPDPRGHGECQQNLEHIYATLWDPLHRYFRRRCRDADSAVDMTQAFFLSIIERREIQRAIASGVPLRPYFLKAAKHFSINSQERERALMRTPSHGWNTTRDVSELCDLKEGASQASADRVEVNLHVVQGAVDRALVELRRIAQHRGLLALLDAVSPGFVGERTDRTYTELTQEFGGSEGALRAQVHRLRTRFRELVSAHLDTAATAGRNCGQPRRSLVR